MVCLSSILIKMEKSMKLNFKSFIVCILILIATSWIGNQAYNLSKELQDLKIENDLYRTELDSINKTLAHRERIAHIYSDRYDFLRYAISSTTMRVSLLEHQWKDYESTFIDAKKYFNMIDKLQSIQPG